MNTSILKNEAEIARCRRLGWDHSDVEIFANSEIFENKKKFFLRPPKILSLNLIRSNFWSDVMMADGGKRLFQGSVA